MSALQGDIVIVGSGLAGLFTALKLSPLPVTVISAEPLGTGTSSGRAQGGVAAAVSEGDTAEAHARDTIEAGAGIVQEKMARLLASEAAGRIEDLLSYGVPFDKDLEGRLKLSREAAHSARRIVRVKGDMAGKAIMEAVTEAASKTPSIRIIEGYSAHELIKTGRQITGVSISPVRGKATDAAMVLPARAVVLASGGIGQLYAITTNPRHARGDGIAMAARAGAVIADAEFVQFHPTSFDIGRDPAPLASEALRGDGATLVNSDGKRFMSGIHQDMELAPRDIVARAVYCEIQAGRGAFLDCREAIGERFAEDFPTIYQTCKSEDIDPATQLLPVAPAAHYHMGGVLTDANGRTSVDGLWACGEVASTGAHGANRLASNSLLETVVFGARIATDLTHLVGRERASSHDRAPEATKREQAEQAAPDQLARLRGVMTAQVGVVRDRDGLADALSQFTEIEKDEATPSSLRNIALAARFVAAAAYAREESRGGHFRSDYPVALQKWARRSFLTLKDVDAITRQAEQPDHAATNVIHAKFGT